MFKLIRPDSFGFHESPLQAINVSSRGLIGNDRRDFEKIASASGILQELDEIIKTAKADEKLVLLIAMGSTEAVGPNRNGDGFRAKVLEACHPTFVKHARWYRNHQNKNPEKSYGLVIKSAYSKPMQRIELICKLNGSEEAARRNGGLVADKELEKLASGKEISVSMATKLPFDVCSACGNKSTAPAHYCEDVSEGGHCKAGGLKNNMGSLVDLHGSVHHLHADNPAPLTFFDISDVYRPADRTAFVLGELQKSAASTGRLIKSAELAAAYGIEFPAYNTHDRQYAETAYPTLVKLAEIENTIDSLDYTPSIAYSFAATDTNEIDVPDVPVFKQAAFFKAAAQKNILLPVEVFLAIIGRTSVEKVAEAAVIVKSQLPGIYNRKLRSGANFQEFTPDTPVDTDSPYLAWAEKNAQHFSLRPEHISRRELRANLQLKSVAISREPEKQAFAPSDNVMKLAEAYAAYKLELVDRVEALNADVANMAVLQDYLSA